MADLARHRAAARRQGQVSFPVALGVGQTTGLDPRPFVMAVIYGASCTFLTPYGYQTKLMVMSSGRYTLRDFARAGAPLALVYQATALVAIPVFFPLRRAARASLSRPVRWLPGEGVERPVTGRHGRGFGPLGRLLASRVASRSGLGCRTGRAVWTDVIALARGILPPRRRRRPYCR